MSSFGVDEAMQIASECRWLSDPESRVMAVLHDEVKRLRKAVGEQTEAVHKWRNRANSRRRAHQKAAKKRDEYKKRLKELE